MSFKVALLSKQGGRKRNEDYAAFSERNGYGCYLVADGLGGHQGGEVASRTACESVIKAFHESPGTSANHLTGYLEYAGQALIASKLKLGLNDAVKTTLVVLLTDNKKATWAHIGDSRLYYFQSNHVVLQTKDHSLPQRLADIGEISADQIRFHEDRNRLIHVFEGEDINNFTYLEEPVSLDRGESFLLCSDGFWDYVCEAEMENDLQSSQTPEEWLARMESRLLERAEGNYDNYTALAVSVT